jgi:hypothetical protein
MHTGLHDTPAAAIRAVADLPTVLNNATGWLVGILAVLATFFLTLGGVRYMTAGGDPSEVERARARCDRPASGTRWHCWHRCC